MNEQHYLFLKNYKVKPVLIGKHIGYFELGIGVLLFLLAGIFGTLFLNEAGTVVLFLCALGITAFLSAPSYKLKKRTNIEMLITWFLFMKNKRYFGKEDIVCRFLKKEREKQFTCQFNELLEI